MHFHRTSTAHLPFDDYGKLNGLYWKVRPQGLRIWFLANHGKISGVILDRRTSHHLPSCSADIRDSQSELVLPEASISGSPYAYKFPVVKLAPPAWKANVVVAFKFEECSHISPLCGSFLKMDPIKVNVAVMVKHKFSCHWKLWSSPTLTRWIWCYYLVDKWCRHSTMPT